MVNNQSRYFFIKLGVILFSICSSFPTIAITAPLFPKHTVLPSSSNIWEKGYVTVGQHNSGSIAGLFITDLLESNTAQFWIDSGLIVLGAGAGYRQLIKTSLLGQNWFAGAYVYYDVMKDYWEDLLERKTLNLLSSYKSPVRWNIGGELGASQWGQLTVNGFGMFDGTCKLSSEKESGVSGRLTVNFIETLKPFIGFAYSNTPDTKNIVGGTIGAKYIVSSWANIEGKYNLDNYEHKHQSPIHIGIYIDFGQKGAQYNSFTQPPERYIPYYYNACSNIWSSFHDTMSNLA